MKQLFAITFCILMRPYLFAQDTATPTPQWRPLYHFTPEKNWTNDPNGLIFVNGQYHLYNQQNPVENFWGHMSWGHATSTDLVHWKHLPVAISEGINGDDTIWRFSGSAVLDKNNTSGWCPAGDCIVAVYTAHQPHIRKESQYVAYSIDGGMTFTHYEKNPVIDLNKQDFRDPNVFWYEPGKYWLMTVVLPAEHKARFYKSLDLKDWKLLSEFGPQGYTGANWECPFLIQLPVEGTQQKKWALIISAAGGERGVFEQYFIGDFDGKEFRNINPPDTVLSLDYGDAFYAAIPWNNVPGNKHVYIGWMIPNPQPTYPWRGQMSIPRDLGLRQTNEGIRLIQQPSAIAAKGLKNFSVHSVKMKNYTINKQEVDVGKRKIKGNAYWIKSELAAGQNTIAGFKIAQKKDKDGKIISETLISYDANRHQLIIDRSKGGGQLNEKALKRTIDLPATKGKVQLDILLDKSSLEVFVNNGEAVLTTYIYPDEDADGISAFVQHGKATFLTLNIIDLSIFK
jgi:levanase/fructan beta-fructosidase